MEGGRAGPAPDRVPPWSERAERSRLGRTLISLLVVAVLLCQVGTHLPPSALEREVRDVAARGSRLLGVEQVWGVFAPNPRTTSVAVEAVVTFADGHQTTWTLPEGPRLGANLRFYRWRKWLERVRADAYRGIWRPTAEWVAEEHQGGSSPVVRVELVRRSRPNEASVGEAAWTEETYFTLEVTGGEP